jgi:hypothetical protein
LRGTGHVARTGMKRNGSHVAEFYDDLVYLRVLIDWAQQLEESTQLITNAPLEHVSE